MGCLSRPAASTSRRNRSHGRLVAGEGGRQDLQCHDPAQPAVAGLEDHAHAALAQLVEDEVVADQEAAALVLVDGGRLVGGQPPGLLEEASQSEHALRLGDVGGLGVELGLVEEADVDEGTAELGQVSDAGRALVRPFIGPGDVQAAEDGRFLVDRGGRAIGPGLGLQPPGLGRSRCRFPFVGRCAAGHAEGPLVDDRKGSSRRTRVPGVSRTHMDQAKRQDTFAIPVGQNNLKKSHRDDMSCVTARGRRRA